MNYYSEIKNELINNEITKKIKDYSKNRSDLKAYYNVGKLLNEAGKHYGEGIIKEYSKKLTNELGKGYTPTRLKYYRRFFVVFSNWQTLSANLTFSHYCEIIWLGNDEMNYYIKIAEKQNLSVRKLRERIKSNEYERLPEETKNNIITENKMEIVDLIKDPILIKSNSKNNLSEKALQKLILEDIPSFLEELGTGFTFIKNEYPIKLGNIYNYIDLLLFNTEYNCYVVIELKVVPLKKEHIGQIEIYMNYIDENLRKSFHDKTIGIIICKENNKYVIKYTSDKRIFTREYELV